MLRLHVLNICILVLFLSACQPEPWEVTTRCQEPDSAAQLITVDGAEICVDEVVSGKLCNAYLRGIVYIEPEIKIAAWDELPNFLKECDFQVAEGSIILVGDHNNTPYYNGCSCHTETNTLD
jgi:hypothetical protein